MGAVPSQVVCSRLWYLAAVQGADTNTILRQIAASCDVRVTSQAKFEPKLGCDVWILRATRGKQTWMTAHDSKHEAACELAKLIGMEGADERVRP